MNEPLAEIAVVKPEFGYRPTALKNNVFIKPVPKDHPGRLITPPAYEPSVEIGFVSSVGPEVESLKPGDLVLFDKFAIVGNEFELLDEDGELVPTVRLQDDFVYAILSREKL